jgi:hypothetical protein
MPLGMTLLREKKIIIKIFYHSVHIYRTPEVLKLKWFRVKLIATVQTEK